MGEFLSEIGDSVPISVMLKSKIWGIFSTSMGETYFLFGIAAFSQYLTGTC